jgi:PadR family transcriptional regulator PadR
MPELRQIETCIAGEECDVPLLEVRLAIWRRLRFATVSTSSTTIAAQPCQGGPQTGWLTAPAASAYTNLHYRMPIRKNDIDNRFEYRDLYAGLIRLHILHHAVEGPIFGLEMAEELARHRYRISLGTLYPLLHGLEKKGYLRSVENRNGQSIRKVYRATPLGRKAFKAMKVKVSELFGELNETR